MLLVIPTLVSGAFAVGIVLAPVDADEGFTPASVVVAGCVVAVVTGSVPVLVFVCTSAPDVLAPEDDIDVTAPEDDNPVALVLTLLLAVVEPVPCTSPIELVADPEVLSADPPDLPETCLPTS